MNKSNNKKLINGIVFSIVCILLVIVIVFILIENDEEKEVILFDDKIVVTVPEVEKNVKLKKVDFFTDFFNVNVYEGKYFVDAKRLYDVNGNLLLEADSYLSYENGIFKSINGIYDVNGNLLVNKNGMYVNFYDNYFEIDDKFYNYDGELLFDGSVYNDISFNDDLDYFAVKRNDKWGLIKRNGEVILPFEYDYMEIKSNTCVIYHKNNKQGSAIHYVYDINNAKEYGPYVGVTFLKDNLVIVRKYLIEDIESISKYLTSDYCMYYILDLVNNTETIKEVLNDYFISSSDFGSLFGDYIIAGEIFGKDGVFDKNFNIVVPFEYDRIDVYEDEDLDDKYLELIKDNSVKILDKELNNVLELNLDDWYEFYDDLVIKIDDSNISLYDIKGIKLYQMEFDTDDTYSYLGNGLVLFENSVNKTCFYVNVNDKEKKRKDIDYSICSNNYWGDDYLLKNGSYGNILFNKKGKRIFKNEYLTISTYDNFCVVSDVKDKYYIINYQEEKLIDMEFIDYRGLNDGGLVFNALDGSKYYFNYE